MAGGFAHLSVVAELYARLRKLDLALETKGALSGNRPFAEVGCVAPDYPYLALSPFTGAGEWADMMHYRSTGELIRCGVRWLRRERPGTAPGDADKALAWLFGYAAHVGTDLTIHPVVERRVGSYEENARDHRICEMNQDSWIWTRRNLGTVNLSEYFTPIMTNTSDDEGRLAAPVVALWTDMLRTMFPDEYEQNPPDIQAWHSGYRRVINVAEETAGLVPFTRHLLKGTGAVYPSPNDVDLSYIKNLETPAGPMDYDKVFDLAVDNVAAIWTDLDRALTAEDAEVEAILARLPDADLDNGRMFADGTQALWRVA